MQDPYSLRCQPQVMGACLELIRSSAVTLLTEANAVSDNPLVFADAEFVGLRYSEPAGESDPTQTGA